MIFSERLNRYIGALACTAQRLSEVSGISMPTLSRYRNDHSLPDEATLRRLAGGLAVLAEEKGLEGYTEESIFEELSLPLRAKAERFDYDELSKRLNLLVSELGLNLSDLASYCNLDKSYLYRICTGQRRPRDPVWIAERTARFVTRSDMDINAQSKLWELIGSGADDSAGAIDLREALSAWLSAGSSEEKDAVRRMLTRMDVFDLDEYLRARSFGKVKLPTVPFQIPATKRYSGVRGMEKGLVEFLKASVMSKSGRDVVIYSDHPMDHCTDESDFPQQWMRGIAALLLKGLHIHMIHNIDRPFREMMLGLEAWIPLYMTGQISPYYFENTQHNTYHHLLLVSGGAALSGDAIPGYPESGQYTLHKANTELARCRGRSEQLLERAGVLMEIYKRDRAKEFGRFLREASKCKTPCKRLLTAPPLHTISEGLLERILRHNRVSAEEAEGIRRCVDDARREVEQILDNSSLSDNIAIWDAEEFSRYPVGLALTHLCGGTNVYYRYEEYWEHIMESEAFAAGRERYRLTLDRAPDFRNIQITIREGKYAIVSKSKAPGIHFVLRHPKMVRAIDQLVMVIRDDERG